MTWGWIALIFVTKCYINYIILITLFKIQIHLLVMGQEVSEGSKGRTEWIYCL